MAHFNDVIDNGASLPVEHPVWEDIQHGAVLSVSIADADAICERIGLDNWVTLIHTLQLGLEEALSQERYHLQTRRGDDGAVTVAMVQPATTPDRALTLLAGGFLVMQSLDGVRSVAPAKPLFATTFVCRTPDCLHSFLLVRLAASRLSCVSDVAASAL